MCSVLKCYRSKISVIHIYSKKIENATPVITNSPVASGTWVKSKSTSCSKVHELTWGHWRISNHRQGTLSVFLNINRLLRQKNKMLWNQLHRTNLVIHALFRNKQTKGTLSSWVIPKASINVLHLSILTCGNTYSKRMIFRRIATFIL